MTKTDRKHTGTTRRKALLLSGATAATLFAPPVVSAIGQTKIKIRVVNSASNTVRTMQELVKELGYYEEFGLDVETTNVADGSKVVAAIVSGDFDACMLAGFPQVIPAIEKGAPLKIIAGALTKSDSVIYSARANIKSVKDLAGKTIGAGAVGSDLYWLVVAVLRKHGVDPNTVTFVNVGSGTDVFKAVLSGEIDAGPAQVEFMDAARKYNVHALPDGAFWEQLPNYSDQGSYTSDPTIQNKPDALVRLLAAYGKLYRFVCSPGSKAAYLKARITALGPKSDQEGGIELWNFFQKYHPYAVNLILSQAQADLAQTVNIEAGSQKIMLPYTKIVNTSLAHGALKLIGGPI